MVKMPAATAQRSAHLVELEKGLKNLKSSKMRKTKDFDTMYDIIEQHHRTLKLGYLTGMPSDRRKQAEQDCKFYYILIKMLGELDKASDIEKQSGLAQIFNWFEENKQVLHTGPRFGRARKRSAPARTESSLGDSLREQSALLSSNGSSSQLSDLQPRRFSTTSQISSALQKRRASTYQTSVSEDSTHKPAPSPAPSRAGSEVSAAAEYYYQQYGGGHIEDVGLKENTPDSPEETGCCPSPIQSITTRPRSAPTPNKDQRPLAPTPDTAMRGRRPPTAGSEQEVLLPRRKPHPLPHVFNPLSKAFEATVELPGSGASTDRSGNFQLSSRGGSVYQDQAGGVISLRMTHLQKWGSYQQNQNMGQDFLSKMQHVGRNGVPGSVRYAAHENSPMAEDMTQEVIANYALLDELAKKQQGRTLPTGDSKQLLEKPLEEFYQSTEPYYPVQRPKYPNFRGKSAPPAGKLQRHGSDKENIHNAGSTQSIDSGIGSRNQSSVKLDTLVNMIDTITDEITFHKEKIAPDPMPGFRQPVLFIDPGSRPQTAPPGARTRPSSADDLNRDARSDSHMYSQVAPERGLLLQRTNSEMSAPSRALTALEMIDWRGKVTPESARVRWNQGFGNHSYVKKSGRPRSSLRSASSSAMATARKPMAPITTEEPKFTADMIAAENKRPAVAASHTTTEVDSGVVSSLLTTTKFNSGKIRKRPEMSEEEEMPGYLYFDGISSYQGEHSVKGHTAEEPREYITICNSMGAHKDAKTESKQTKQENQKSQSSAVRAKVKQDESASRAPVMADTGNFLEEVKRLIADGALEEEDNNEGHPNTARSKDDRQQEQSQSEASEPGEVKKQLTFVLADGTEVKQRDEDYQHYDDQAMEVYGEEDNQETMDPSADFGLNEDEAQIMKVGVGYFLKNIDRSGSVPRQASAQLAKSYKQRVFHHSFPRHHTNMSEDEHVENHQDIDELTIEGRGAKTKALRKNKSGEGNSKKANVSRSRSAGTSPTRAKSANPLKVLQKQSEMLKNSPVEPYRTPPSIPTPWGQFGTRTIRPHTAVPNSNVYMAEIEAHSRKMKSPRHYIEKAGGFASRNIKISDLRRSDSDPVGSSVPRLQPASEMSEAERGLIEPLKVFRMTHEDGTMITISSERPRPPTRPKLAPKDHECTDTTCAACLQEQQGNQQGPTGEFAGQRLLDMGRPIPHYLPAADPVEVAAAMERQTEVQAAVDIQRIFRGYVARNHYKYLVRDERQKREDKQKAAVEIQRHMRGHLARKRAIHNRKPRQVTLDWAKKYKELLKERERRRQIKSLEVSERNARKKAESDSKLAIIGPHVEVYAPFHPKKTGADKALLNRAATIISKTVRGWLIRLKMEKLMRKARYHANSWTKFITAYKELLRRIQLRAGVDKPKTPFDFKELSEYMDIKKRYESVFDKRAFGGEMEMDEIPEYFKECDLYPGKTEIEEAVASVFRGQALRKNRGFYKQEMLEITFQIYPLPGSGIVSTRKSTWLNPILDGEEAIKLKGKKRKTGTDSVEPTDFKTCWKLVSGTAKDRRAEIAKQLKEEEDKKDRALEEQRQAALKLKKKAARKTVKTDENVITEGNEEESEQTPEAVIPETEVSQEEEVVIPPPEEETIKEEQKEVEETKEKVEEEEKSFIEQKLELIEKKAPDWVPHSVGQENADSKEISLETTTQPLKKLEKIVEVVDHEPESNVNSEKKMKEKEG